MRGLTLAAVADALGYANGQGTISLWENGERTGSVDGQHELGFDGLNGREVAGIGHGSPSTFGASTGIESMAS